MPDDPYRPYPVTNPDDELARLAQQGQRRIQAAAAGQSQHVQVEGSRHLRVAVGAVRGSTVRRAFLVLAALGVLTLIAGFALVVANGDPVFVPLLPLGFASAMGGFMVYVFMPPVASRAAMEAERAWVAALPFAFEGYFETLSAEPSAVCKLRIELVWQTVGADPATLQGVVGLLDTDARVTQAAADVATITSGVVSGATGIRINRVPVHRNHRVATYLHRLVEVVLLPVHRNRPLARVSVSRGW